MTGPITWEMAGVITAIVLGIGAIWWRIEARIRLTEAKAEKINEDLQRYKLDAANHYASILHLEKVEARLVKSIDNLTATVRSLPDQIAGMIDKSRRY